MNVVETKESRRIVLRAALLSAAFTATLLPFVASSAAHAQGVTSNVYAFTDLGALANVGMGANTRAIGIDNGTAVGSAQGYNFNYDSDAFQWNADGSTTNLTTVAASTINGSSDGAAEGISGGVTVGVVYGGDAGSGTATRWNADGTVTNLGAALAANGIAFSPYYSDASSQAVAISNGVAAGYATGRDNYGSRHSLALRWNADGTVTNLQTQADTSLGYFGTSEALGISNGVTVGYDNNGSVNNAVRWNADGTVTNLNTLANSVLGNGGGATSSTATGISNGVTVGYGSGFNTGAYAALRWNADGTVTNLQSYATSILGTNVTSQAAGIAGGVTVGYGYGSTFGTSTPIALRWNPDGTALNLQQFVTNSGASGSYALGVDTDGEIVGITDFSEAAKWTPVGATVVKIKPHVTTRLNQSLTQTANISVDGTFDLGSNTLTVSNATINGVGTLAGNLIVSSTGVLAPGHSPGTLTLSSGNFTLNGGTYSVDLAGLGAGQFDVLNIASGVATFSGGTLSINDLNGYTPAVGDFFDIVTTSGGVFGANSVSAPTGWTFTANGTNGRLSYIGGGGGAAAPEPSALALLLPLLPVAAALWRRRAQVGSDGEYRAASVRSPARRTQIRLRTLSTSWRTIRRRPWSIHLPSPTRRNWRAKTSRSMPPTPVLSGTFQCADGVVPW